MRSDFALVVPFHNEERHLSTLIESLRRQDHTDVPVVFVDNGSTDCSAALVRRCDEVLEASRSLATPATWAIAPLAHVALAVVDCPHSTPKWTFSGRICVRTNQFRPGRLELSGSRFVSEETFRERIERLQPQSDDILYSREGGILGVACRVPPDVDLGLGQRMMLIRSASICVPAFLELVLNSPIITNIALAKTTGGAAPRVNVATVKSYPIPIPPVAEQQQIVAKVDELMALCDRLEKQLALSEAQSGRFLGAVLHEALDETLSDGSIS